MSFKNIKKLKVKEKYKKFENGIRMSKLKINKLLCTIYSNSNGISKVVLFNLFPSLFIGTINCTGQLTIVGQSY